MAPASLHRLPIEVLHMILGYLRFHCSGGRLPEPPDAYFCGDQQEPDQPAWYSLKLQPLVSLCLVSRRLCKVAQGFLYHDFMLGYGDSWRSELYTWDGRLTSFMRTVAHRRDLAAHVKRIYIHPYLLECFDEEKALDEHEAASEWPGSEWPGPGCPSTPMLHRAHPRQRISEDEARSALREVAHALKIRSLKQLSARDLVTVLILELPNLEHCSLQVGLYKEDVAPSRALQAAGISHLPIKTIDVSLRASSLEAHHHSLFYLDQRVGALLDVSQCLETLNLHMCYGSSTGLFPTLPNLKNLRLSFSRFSERNLRGLLSSCRSLRTFLYEATYAPYNPDVDLFRGYDHFQLSDAVKYLSLHRETLESVHLDLRKRGLTFSPPVPRAIFSLKKFTVLKDLFLNLDEFHTRFMAADPLGDQELLVQILPSSIVSLNLAGSITEELPRLEESLFGLAHAVSHGQFPKLKQVRWDEKEKLNDELGVRSMFATAGVNFDYNRWPMSMTTLGDGDWSPQPNYYNIFSEDPDL
ncbi:hypothetical protein ATEIFO6365_0005071200 [Aspergillus terreus]|uniref:Uncharacterized protein n=1 Tax=Aspergillus terreus TaxID=33178 RepID=A0A5M3Z5R7_ASPTE|nr:hypothetical protein ATETN484_0007055300 [Aspergillus terreus]GFF16520.1 hypothetical protein ATEIFO6365_0005071200 [Aspergillus terreus]